MTNAAVQNKTQQAAAKRDLSEMKPREKIAHLLDERKSELAKILPKHLSIERLLKVATIAATTTPALLECEIASLVSAIGQCAQIGLEPNTILGHAYLVPFNAKKKNPKTSEVTWVKQVQVIIGFRGLIDLAKRSGEIRNIGAHEVRENDEFSFEYGLNPDLKHKIDVRKDRGAIVAFYAHAKLKDGSDVFEVMSKDEVDEIMVGTQSKGEYGPWKDNYPEMGRKTLIRRLAKYLPLSIEFQTAVALDNQAESGAQHIDSVDGEYFVVPDNDFNQPKEKKSEITMPASKKANTEKPLEKAIDAIGGEEIAATKNKDQPITADQLETLKGVLNDTGVDEVAFEEEFGYKPEELPARLFEGTLKQISDLVAS
jgi:recombination protein RecT